TPSKWTPTNPSNRAPNLTKGTPKHNDGPRPTTEAHTPHPPSAGQLLLQLHRTLLTASHHLTGHLLHLFQHTLTLTLGQPIHIHHAQGVIGLVLQTPRKKPRTRHHDLSTTFVHTPHRDPLRTPQIRIRTRNRQTPLTLIHHRGVKITLIQHRIDHMPHMTHTLIIRTVINKQTQIHPHLITGQPHPLGRIHRPKHVVHQLRQLSPTQHLRRHIRTGPMQDLLTDHGHPQHPTTGRLRGQHRKIPHLLTLDNHRGGRRCELDRKSVV